MAVLRSGRPQPRDSPAPPPAEAAPRARARPRGAGQLPLPARSRDPDARRVRRARTRAAGGDGLDRPTRAGRHAAGGDRLVGPRLPRAAGRPGLRGASPPRTSRRRRPARPRTSGTGSRASWRGSARSPARPGSTWRTDGRGAGTPGGRGAAEALPGARRRRSVLCPAALPRAPAVVDGSSIVGDAPRRDRRVRGGGGVRDCAAAVVKPAGAFPEQGFRCGRDPSSAGPAARAPPSARICPGEPTRPRSRSSAQSPNRSRATRIA